MPSECKKDLPQQKNQFKQFASEMNFDEVENFLMKGGNPNAMEVIIRSTFDYLSNSNIDF